MTEYVNATFQCESCEFGTQVTKEAIRHSGTTGHALSGENANGSTITIQILADEE